MMMAVTTTAITCIAQEQSYIPMTQQPEGTIRAYFRKGMATSRGTALPFAQNEQMAMMVCFAPDGKTVYLQNPVSAAPLDTWVKGELDEQGTTLTVPLPQPLWWYDNNGYGLLLAMVHLDVTETSYSSVYNELIDEVTFTLEGDEIRLNGTSQEMALGLIYTDDYTCVGMNDYETVYHYEGDELVQIPADATTERYVVNAMNQDRTYEENINAEVAVKGDDVWFKGYTAMLPTAWIHGTREGDKVHLPKNQLVGTYGGYPLFYCSNQGNDVADGVWSYNAETQTYTADNFSFINAHKNDLYHYGYYRTLEYKPAPKHDGAYQIQNDPIVSKQPQGELRTMMRSGLAYFYNEQGDYVAYTSQGGMPMRMVFAEDGVVWMLNPVSYCSEDKWVKGQLNEDGTLLTVKLGQQLYYDASEGWGYATALLRYNEQKKYFDIDEDVAEVTFSVDGDKLTLLGTDQWTVYGVIYTDDYSWTGYGDYNSVYTPAPTEYATMPAELDAQRWTVVYTDHEGTYGGRTLNVAMTSDSVYISNLTDKDPLATIVGSIEGDKVTFMSGQYIGNGTGYYCYFDAGKRIEVYNRQEDQWYYDWDYAPSITLAMDSQKRQLKAMEEGQTMMIDAGMGEIVISYMTIMDTPTMDVFEDRPMIPADPKFTVYDETYFYEEDGYTLMGLDIQPYDIDGNVIPLENLYYRLITSIYGENEVYTFYADEYINLKKDMDLVPFAYTDDYDFGRGGSYIYLYEIGWDDLGAQVVCTTGGEERVSNIVWVVKGVEEGSGSQAINTIHADASALPCYNLMGQRVKSDSKGMIISGGKVSIKY